MLILTNCLTEAPDEGCLRLSASLIKRIKLKESKTFIVSYDRESSLDDVHLQLSKFLISRELISIIRKHNASVLYVPFPARASSTALRIFLLSLFCKKLSVVLPMRIPVSGFSKLLFKLSKADLIVFSAESASFYSDAVGEKRIKYLKAGVDTEQFVPVSEDKAAKLKLKYGFSADKPVILHVGHLNRGRGVAELMKLNRDYQILLVTSTLTKSEQDKELRAELLACPNVRLIDDYQPHIEQLYQLCDVYFFPVAEQGRCIDIPLSCMEAAACNKPVVTTGFGEMNEFRGREGFFFIESFSESALNDIIACALKAQGINTREAVIAYDWNNAVSFFEM